MNQQQRSLRFGAVFILCALLLRMADAGIFQSLADLLAKPNITSAILYLETGRVVRFSPSLEVAVDFSLESATPDFAKKAPELPSFSPEDAEFLQMRYNCRYRPDLSQLLTWDLSWDLRSSEPSVLILHTHATESYTKSPGEIYSESALYRTLDERYNMLSVGDKLAELLEAGGIHVLHDRTLHDYPSYNGSYANARKTVKFYLEQYPSIRLILDLHRDASGDANNQMQTHALVAGKDSSQLMLVIGTDSSGLDNPRWEENLALGLKLQVQMERMFPGIMRYVNLRSQRFNQDLLPGMLLVEVGSAGDSHEDAITAVSALAEGILSLAGGSKSS